jgi:hypothetical protein
MRRCWTLLFLQAVAAISVLGHLCVVSLKVLML